MIRSKFASRFTQPNYTRAATMTFFWALLALALHVVPGAVAPLHAQGSRKDDIVFNSRGIPLAGATVRVCAMPATGQPCTPLALIYSDVGLTQALANPTTTDGLGNYSFYAAPGKYEIEISGPSITTKQLPNVVLPNDPSSPTFSGAVSAFSLSLGGNLTVSGNTTVVGSLASGTLTLNNQGTPPGAAGTGTVNLYTKTADMRLYYKDQTGTEIGPLGPGNGAQTNVANTFTAPQNIAADFHTKGPNPSFDLLLYGGYYSGTTPPTITCATTASSNQITCSGGVSDFLVGHGIAIPTAGVAPTMLTPGTPFPIASISVTSNVATATIANSASFAPGSSIVITGSSDSAFNGTFPVANLINSLNLTFNVTHANCSPCAIGGSATVAAATPTAVTPQGVLNGTTTWNYKVVALGFHGELSTASSAFTTTAGAAALGVTNATIAANGCTESNGVVTFTTTAAHNFQSGVPINIPRGSTGTTAVEGSWTIASTPSSTTFTVDIATLPNGTYCSSGGTAQVVAKNLVQWTMQPYAVMGYYIYRSQGAGSYSLVGVSQGMDSAFIDWGLPAPLRPAYVPATPPSSPVNGIFATTITNIVGNTITLANNAVASVASATVFHDNAPNILSVCASTAMSSTGGTIFVPASNPQGSLYVLNSPLNLAAGCPQNTRLQLGAQLFINYPVIPGSANVIEGTIQGAGGNGAGPSFGKYVTTRILGGAYPFFLLEPGSSSDVTFQNLNAECSQAYQSCFVQDQDYSGNNVTTITYDNVYMSGGNYAQPFKMGGGFNFFFRYGGIGTAALAWGIPPSLWDVVDMGFGAFSQQLGGIMEFDYSVMGGGEWLFDTAGETGLLGGTGHLTMYELLNESSYYPSLRFNTGINTINAIRIERMSYADPVGGLSTPMVDLTNALSISNLRVIEPFCATGSQAFFSGAPAGGIQFISGSAGCGTGLPSTTQVINTDLIGGSTTQSFSNMPVAVLGTGQFFYPMAVPAAPASAVVSSGGSVPVGAHTYAITAIDVNGKETTLGASISATTTSGNQTVTLTPGTLPVGAVGYKPYRDGLLDTVTPCSTAFITGVTPYVDTFASECSNNPPVTNGGVTSSLNSNGITTYQLKMANNFTDVVAPAPLTANRTHTLPDVTGIVPVTSYLNSGYDNATRANGAIGSNWTVEQNGLNIASNQIQGTSTGANSAFWAANAFSNSQFAQATITALNGTTDFPGVSVLASGTGSSSTYYACLEDTTNIYIQRVVNTTATNLTSASSTGAVGDLLRLEVAPGGALTCYKNGAVALTFTDTQITSGAPGISVTGNVSTLKNWSGGNLHPLGHLDAEQDWTKTQHFFANGGVCTMSSSTSCTVTLSEQPSTPALTHCLAQVQGATPIAAACGISGTTVTVTAASSNSATWSVFIF
jgi:hypothetical protein